ncbi:MAG: hypothetical protein NZO16_00060 [Deltaproteobacteria bacterium]|nr:hypothetical protein [Deltaproteobacteria bacterium]
MLLIGRISKTLGITILIYGLVGGGLYFPVFEFGLTDQFRGTFVISAVLITIGFYLSPKLNFDPNVIALSPLLFLLSHNQFREHAFFNHYAFVVELVCLFCFIATLKPSLKTITVLSLVLCIVGSFYNFMTVLGNNPIFSDDIPSFVYRAFIIKNSNPIFPTWDPNWNLGNLWTDIYATAAILPTPLLNLSEKPLIFNSAIFIIVLLLPAVSTFLASRILNFPLTTSLLATLLALISTKELYKWGLHFGTLGYLISASFCVLTASTLIRILTKGANKLIYWSLFLFTTITALWPLNLLPILMIVLFGILNKKITWSTIAILALGVLPSLTFVFHGLTYSTVFDKWLLMPVSDRFLKSESFKAFFREHFANLNPLLMFFAPFALLSNRIELKVWFVAYLTIFLFVGYFMPKLELFRVFAHFGIICALLTARYLAAAIKICSRIAVSFIFALLLVSSIEIQTVFSNSSFEKFEKLSKPFQRFVSWAKNENKENMLFLGHIAHNFSGGHIAVLPKLTGDKFIAAYPTHKTWTPVDIIPHEHKNSRLRVTFYLNLFCPDYIITDRRFWKRRVRERMPRVFQFENFSVYRFKFNPEKCKSTLKGEIKNLNESMNVLTFSSPKKQKYIVLKRNHSKVLGVQGCESLEPFEFHKFTFIKLSNCQQGEIRVFNRFQK